MDPDSRWILKEMVSHQSDGLLASLDSTRAPTVSRARWRWVQGLLTRHAGGDRILQALQRLSEAEQSFVFHWVDVIARSDTELARVFAGQAPDALALMDKAGVEAWLVRAMDAYDKRGLGKGVASLEDLHRFASDYARRHIRAHLDEQLAMLQPLIIGLGGRPLTIAYNESSRHSPATAYTDSESIHLPAAVHHFTEARLNRLLLLGQTVFLWAQNRYGTWRLQSLEKLMGLPHPERSQVVYATLERFRIEACLARDLPGLHRHLDELQAQGERMSELSPAWQQARQRLSEPEASADDSLDWIPRLRDEPLPAVPCYQGGIHPQRVRQLLLKRVERERRQLQQSLSELRQPVHGSQTDANQSEARTDGQSEQPSDRFSTSRRSADRGGHEYRPQLEYQGRKVRTPSEVRGLLTSIQQDLGEVPDDYLAVGGNDTPYDADAVQARDRDDIAEPLHYAEGALSYPEWDYNRQRYRRDYCILREQSVRAGDPGFIQQTLQKYRGPLKSIRRSFEAILGEDRLLRRQSEGEDIDIDALIEAQADLRRGVEMDNRVYSHHRRIDRDIAVMFMVDMSGSTRGWINDAEREALVLLCEALETLGDRYAIYGFSGRTHSRCAIYRIKRFDEAYGHDVRGRISGIRPQTYTRMGVAIRHLGGLLRQVPARTKLLVTLSDGKPEDYGSYRGRYGIEDTRRALIEARRNGIHAFCVTIDQEGGDYLPHMYGPANYAVIDQVGQLPLKVADIYRRLTT